MTFPFQAAAIALAGIAAAAPGLAQDAAGRLEAMTCREFLALHAEAQDTVRTAMLAQLSGEPLPDAPLPAGSDAAQAGQAQVVEDETGVDDGGTLAVEAPGEEAGSADASDAARNATAGENESGKTAPDGTEVSVTDEAGDRRLVAMRTSCEGGPDARALDALRAAFGDNL